MLKSIWVLSLPFAFFGLAFFMIGMAPLVSGLEGKKWIQGVAAGCYATASSSGSLFFALNFGDQGGAPVRSWVFRASIIQGTQVSLHDPRAKNDTADMHSASIHFFPLVLGRRAGQDERGGHCEYKSHRHEPGPHHHAWRRRRHLHVGRRERALPWFTRILSPISRPGARLPIRNLPAQDRAVVLHDGGTSRA